MATGTYRYKDSFVAIRYAIVDTAYWDGPHRCVCCNKALDGRERVALLANNSNYFPNVLIHRECLDALEATEEARENMQKLFQKLERMSTQYKELKTYFG